MSMPPTRKATINGQVAWGALAHQIHEHLLDNLFMEPLVISQGHHITQKTGRADGTTGVAHHHRGPVRLVGYRAMAT